MDAETRAAVEELTRVVESQRDEIARLRQQIDLYDIRGLNTLMFRSLFAGSGGLFGTNQQAARSDHSH